MKKEDIIKIVETLLKEDEFLVQLSIDEKNNISIFIDSMQGSIPISECVRITKEIEGYFDRDKEDYAIQVSSAGLDLPFVIPKQYEKYLGKELEIIRKNGLKLSGLLIAFDGEIATIEIEKKELVEGKKRKQIVKKQYQLNINTDIKSAKPKISLKRNKK